jgi:arabinose-5-phosphate isomerase
MTKVLRFTGIRLSALLYEQLGAQPMLAALLGAPSALQVREKVGRRKACCPTAGGQSCYHQKPMNQPNPNDPEPGRPDAAAFKPAELVRTEAAALEALARRLEGQMAEPFARAVELILRCGEERGRVVVTGMGKSGIIAQKIAATLSSTGSPALFLHPAEAVHGDLGVLMPGDVVVALSSSGETEEILRLLATLKRKGDALVSFCCNLNSTLAAASDVALDCGVEREACGLNLAPTASTTTMLALGDALAVAVSLRKGFRAEDFAELHPGGKLGKRLAKVRDLMHCGDQVPVVASATPMTDVIYEMSSKKLGITTVQERGRLCGVISDGDLRRLLEREGGAALSRSAGEAMNPHPRTIAASELAASALAIMEERKITSLIVVDANQTVEGVLHLHDLWGVELI